MKLTKLILAAAIAATATPAFAIAVITPRVVVVPRAAPVAPRVTPTVPRVAPPSYRAPVYTPAPIIIPPYASPSRKCDRDKNEDC